MHDRHQIVKDVMFELITLPAIVPATRLRQQNISPIRNTIAVRVRRPIPIFSPSRNSVQTNVTIAMSRETITQITTFEAK